VLGGNPAAIAVRQCRRRLPRQELRGYERYVGLGILGRNLQMLGKLLLAPGRRRLSVSPIKTQQASRLGAFQQRLPGTKEAEATAKGETLAQGH